MATLNIKGFPDDLYDELRAKAEREHRSLSQEVIHLLSKVVESEPRSLLELRGMGSELWGDTDVAKFVAEERASWDD